MTDGAGTPEDRRRRDKPARASFRDLCFIGRARDCTVTKVRAAQVQATAALMPLASVVNCTVAPLMAVAMWKEVPHWQLIAWVCATFVLGGVRIAAVRLNRRSASAFALVSGAVAASLLWVAPLILWAPFLGPGDRVLVAIALAGMMSGGSVILANVPPAALAYIATMCVGSIAIAAGFTERMLTPLIVAYGAALVSASIRYALQFADQMNTRVELQEKIDLLGLLREFGSSGSDWLWELDGDRRVTYISNDFAGAAGAPAEEIVGKEARELLDPRGDIAPGCAGMSALFDHLARGTSFHDLAIPYRGRWWSISGKPLIDDGGKCIGWRGVGSDITEFRLHGSDATRAARRDPMTGLSNRLLLREELEQALLPDAGGECALMLIDLDRFKLVNDTLGHTVGDELLKMAGKRLEASVGDLALVGRIGGDEFAIVWPSAIDRLTLGEFARAVIAKLSEVFLINEIEVRIGATIGIAIAPGDGTTQQDLTSSADLALYRAKEIQRGSFCFYEKWMGETARENRRLESELRRALENGGLTLAYQPIIRSSDRKIIAYEALLRWNHPERGDIPPSLFVPIIEESGLITRVGNWVIEQACADAAGWPDPVPVAVNISAAQLTGSWLASTVAASLSSSGLEPDRLQVEVTESIFLGDDEVVLAALADLRALGVHLVLDDFGKGYSAFGYLVRAEFSKVKIDREFVHGAAAGEREHLAIVEAIIALSRRLGIEATAEGIETARQEEMMRSLGCDEMQGFRFGRPAPSAAIHSEPAANLRHYG
jgi:diguanylate cyclase (GGDEF)-like protein